MAVLFYPPSVNGLQKTLGAALDEAFTTAATLNNTTNIQNQPGIFVVDRIDTNGDEKPAADREYISFTAVSGSTLTGLTRGIGGSTDQDHAVGAVVEFIPDVVWAQMITDALNTLVTSADTSVVNTANVVTPTGTQALTNKRVTPRVSTEASSATPTINTDNVDAHSITALATDVTSMTTNLSGTPTNFQKLIIRFKDDGTARAITWGASFEAKGTALPTTTVISKVLTVGFIYDTVTSKWGCVASSQEA